MILLASVEIRHNESNCTNQNPIKNKCKSKLTIGKKKPKDLYPILVISSNYDKIGKNYQVFQNIVKIFNNRTSQGIATLRFKSPNHDVLISKANTIQLKAFLHVLGAFSKSSDFSSDNSKSFENHSIHISTLIPFSSKEVEKTKMKIISKLDYPITTNFPFSLVQLSINGINLKKIDLRIFNLKHLKELNLSENSLTNLPENGWNDLHSLINLDLSSNQIKSLAWGFCCSDLAARLIKLNLSNNKIQKLPFKIRNFKNLVELHLTGNILEVLPESFLYLKCLKTLILSHNKIRSLPGSFLFMKLHSLDVTFQESSQSFKNPLTEYSLPSLYELAARRIVDKKISYAEVDILSQAYIDCHKICSVCRKSCFESTISSTTFIELNRIAENVLRNKDIPLTLYLCCFKCYEKVSNQIT